MIKLFPINHQDILIWYNTVIFQIILFYTYIKIPGRPFIWNGTHILDKNFPTNMTIPDSTSSQYKSAHQVMTPQLQLFAVSQNILHSMNSIFTRFLAIVASISVNGKYILRIPTVHSVILLWSPICITKHYYPKLNIVNNSY